MGAIRRVVAGPARGCKFKVSQGFGGSYAFGSEALHIKSLSNMSKVGDTVFDIGANRGHVTLVFARSVGTNGRVVAFEPVPSLLAAIGENVALNGLSNVTICPKALSDSEGTIQFEYSDQHSTQGKIPNVEPGLKVDNVELITVETITLDEYLSSDSSLPSPDMMKIDVEGAAGLVLKGARATIAKHRPRIFIELHGVEEQAAVHHELIENGYQAFALNGDPVDDVTTGWESPLILSTRN